MSGEALSTYIDVYHVHGEVVLNVVEMMDHMVHFREIMLGYANIGRKHIMLSDEWYFPRRNL